jgi:hypothetical protein
MPEDFRGLPEENQSEPIPTDGAAALLRSASPAGLLFSFWRNACARFGPQLEMICCNEFLQPRVGGSE